MRRDLTALTAFIDSRQNVPHAIGRSKNDCISFALGAVEAETGIRVAASIKWESPVAAMRALKKLGGVEKAFDRHFDRVPIAFAKRGDIAGVQDEELGIHPMIVEGDRLVAPGEKGNRRLPRSAMTIAWDATTVRKQ